VDHWINNYGLTAIGLTEVIVIGFIFGTRDFRIFINSVSEVKVGIWWDIMIRVVTPSLRDYAHYELLWRDQEGI
jgi:NSS family neurotransmitter:Na+ symporter